VRWAAARSVIAPYRWMRHVGWPRSVAAFALATLRHVLGAVRRINTLLAQRAVLGAVCNREYHFTIPRIVLLCACCLTYGKLKARPHTRTGSLSGFSAPTTEGGSFRTVISRIPVSLWCSNRADKCRENAKANRVCVWAARAGGS